MECDDRLIVQFRPRELIGIDEHVGIVPVISGALARRGVAVSGGAKTFRKLRYALSGRRKSGGVRVIYYWLRDDGQVYMLLIYPKSKKDELTDRETALLRELVKEL